MASTPDQITAQRALVGSGGSRFGETAKQFTNGARPCSPAYATYQPEYRHNG